MSDKSSGSPPAEGEQPAPPRRPLVGGATIRELEQRDRELKLRAARAERVSRGIRLVALLLFLVAAGLLVVAWQPVRTSYAAAGRELQALNVELELQLTEVLRYAPLRRADAEASKRLQDARAEWVSPNLQTKARGIRTVRQFLVRRMPLAKARVQQDWALLYGDFVRRHQASEVSVRERERGYNATASTYNRSVKSFPASLLRVVSGYPRKLPTLKL